MSPLWLIPGLVVLLGAVLLLALLRGVAEEARLLAVEIARQREVGEGLRRLAVSLRSLGGRLPARR